MKWHVRGALVKRATPFFLNIEKRTKTEIGNIVPPQIFNVFLHLRQVFAERICKFHVLVSYVLYRCTRLAAHM